MSSHPTVPGSDRSARVKGPERGQRSRGASRRVAISLIVAATVFVALVALVLLDRAGLVTLPWERGKSAAPVVADQRSSPQVKPGAGGPAAPDFSLPGLQGGQVALSQFRGRPVMLNFFAAWCAPCWKEMPIFQQAYERYQGADHLDRYSGGGRSNPEAR